MNGIKTVIFGACAYLNFTRETAVLIKYQFSASYASSLKQQEIVDFRQAKSCF